MQLKIVRAKAFLISNFCPRGTPYGIMAELTGSTAPSSHLAPTLPSCIHIGCFKKEPSTCIMLKTSSSTWLRGPINSITRVWDQLNYGIIYNYVFLPVCSSPINSHNFKIYLHSSDVKMSLFPLHIYSYQNQILTWHWTISIGSSWLMRVSYLLYSISMAACDIINLLE